jgi:hypothetical protein
MLLSEKLVKLRADFQWIDPMTVRRNARGAEGKEASGDVQQDG